MAFRGVPGRVGEVNNHFGKLREDKTQGPANMDPRVLREVAEKISVTLTDGISVI